MLTTQAALLVEQEQLAVAQTGTARGLVASYKSLGGGWQLRQGDDFVDTGSKVEMRERTDWGGLLEPEAAEESAREDIGQRRKPDW